MQHRKNGQPTYNVIDVWKRNITGEGVVVAVVDEGLDPEHPEIRGNYVSSIVQCKSITFVVSLWHNEPESQI